MDAVLEAPATEVPKAAQRLLKDLDTLKIPVDESERKEIIAAVTDADMAKHFLETRLDRGLDPAELKKTALMGAALYQGVEMDAVWATMGLYSIGIMRRMIDHGDNRLRGLDQNGEPLEKPLSEEAILGTQKFVLLAAVEMNRAVPRTQKVTAALTADNTKKGPKNKPPDSLTPPTIHNHAGGQIVVNPK